MSTEPLKALLAEALGDSEEAVAPHASLGSREIPDLLKQLPYAEAVMVRGALRAGNFFVLESDLRRNTLVQKLYKRHQELARCPLCGAQREHQEFDGRFFLDDCAPCSRAALRENWRTWHEQTQTVWSERAAAVCGALHWPRQVELEPKLIALLESGAERGQWGAYLFGRAGTGKTQQAIETIRAYLHERRARLTPGDMERWGGQVPVLPSFRFISESALLRSQRPGGEGGMEQYTQTPLLVLDDLGESKASDWAYETLKHLIDERYKRRALTVFTSNRSLRELRAAGLYDERITSRIFEMCGGMSAHQDGSLAVMELTTSYRMPRDGAGAQQEVMW